MDLQSELNRIKLIQGPLKKWHKIVIALSILVVFCTVYFMIKPALAVTAEQAAAQKVVQEYQDIVNDSSDARVIRTEKYGKDGNLNWSIVDEGKGSLYTLVIWGDGTVPIGEWDDWNKDYKEKIGKVVIGEGVRSNVLETNPLLRESFVLSSTLGSSIEEIVFSSTYKDVYRSLGKLNNLKKISFAGKVNDFNLSSLRHINKYPGYLRLPYDVDCISCRYLEAEPYKRDNLINKDGKTKLDGVEFIDSDGKVSSVGKNYTYDEDSKCLYENSTGKLIAYLGNYQDKIVLPDQIKYLYDNTITKEMTSCLIANNVTDVQGLPSIYEVVLPQVHLDKISDSDRLLANCLYIKYLTLGETRYVTNIKQPGIQFGLKKLNFMNPEKVEELKPDAFSNLPYLELDLVEFSGLKVLGDNCFQGASSIINPMIGPNVTSIGDSCFSKMGYMDKTFRYDAKEAQVNEAPESIFDETRFRNGVLGKNVDKVNDVLLQSMINACDTFTFEGENYFDVVNNVAESFARFSTGNYYVDSNGIVYKLDRVKKTASLAYVPSSLEKFEVPSLLKDTYTVDSVESYALKNADQLKELTFKNPEKIKKLKVYCFSYAKNLEKINGKNDALEIEGTFPQKSVSYNMFDFSPKIKSAKAEVLNKDKISYQRDDVNLTIKAEPNNIVTEALPDENNHFMYYTGQSVPIWFKFDNRSNLKGDNVIRIYLEFSHSKGRSNLEDNATHIIDGVKFTLKKAKSGSLLMFESEPIKKGTTFESSFQVVYDNIKTSGGYCKIWGDILAKEEAPLEDYDSIAPYDSEQYVLRWITRPRKYKIKKQEDGQFEVIGNGKNNNKVNLTKVEVPIEYEVNDNASDSAFRKLNYGIDPITAIEFESVVKLDSSMSWNEDFIEAIKKYKNDKNSSAIIFNNSDIGYIDKNGKKRVALYMESKHYTESSYTPAGSPRPGRRLKWDIDFKDGNVIVHSKLYAVEDDYLFTDGKTENSLKYSFADGIIEMEKPTSVAECSSKIINADTVFRTTYKYSDKITNPSANKKLIGSVNEDDLIVKKERVETGANYGDKVKYKAIVYNRGVLDKHIDSFSDELTQNLYLNSDDIAELINKYGDNVKIEITNATFANRYTESRVAFLNGNSGRTSSQTTSVTHNYSGEVMYEVPNVSKGNTIKIYKSGINTYFEKIEDETDTKDIYLGSMHDDVLDPKQAEVCLNTLQYIPDVNSVYKITWTYPKDWKIYGGEKKTFEIPCHVKNTFMLLGSDRPGRHAIKEFEVPLNSFKAQQNGEEPNVATELEDTQFSVKYDYHLSHQLKNSGKLVNLNEDHPAEGEVLDYTIRYNTNTNGKVEVLPIVTKLCGVSKLLVPVQENISEFSLRGLPTVTEGGTEYYILNKDGTYHYIKYNGKVIDEITVNREKEETIIKAYDENVTGNNSNVLRYKTIINKEGNTGGNLEYTTWLNDCDSHRLLVSSCGTILEFKKKIVSARGTKPEDDKLVPNDYLGLKSGSKVTYRFALTNTGDEPLTLRGNEFYDLLPTTLGLWSWNNDNLKLEYVKGDGPPIKINNENNWEIGSADKDNSQKIIWKDDFSVEYSGANTLYVYVTLTFPNGKTFDAYDDKLSGEMVSNTLYVYKMISQVYHSVISPGKVNFQKGVIFTGDADNRVYNDNMRNVFSTYRYKKVEKLHKYYVSPRYAYMHKKAIFYLTVSNEGNTPLMLNDIEDILPPGFVFQGVSMGNKKNYFLPKGSSYDEEYFYTGDVVANRNKSIAKEKNWNGSIITKDDTDEWVKNMDYHIETDVGNIDPKGQKIKFNLSKHPTSAETLSYNKNKEKYYLKKGQAITIVYQAMINGNDHYENGELKYGTLKKSINRTSMCYDDEFNAGVNIDENSKIVCNKSYVTADSDSPVRNLEKLPLNDGKGRVIDNGAAEAMGFTKDTENRKRLYTDVTLTRGEIKPGITKTVDKRITSAGIEEKYDGYADYKDTIRWKLHLTNDGDNSIGKYVVEDLIEYPYFFTGKVVLDPTINTHDHKVGRNKYELFEIGDIKKNGKGEEFVKIKMLVGNKELRDEYKIGSGPLSTDALSLSISKEDNGFYKMQFTIDMDKGVSFLYPICTLDDKSAIDIYIDTKNISKTYKNYVYTNVANLRIPDLEYQDGYVINGQPLKDKNGKYIKAVSTVTTLTSRQTTSKIIVEDDVTKAKAESDKDPEYLVMSDRNDTINYYLCIDNKSDREINGMTILNNLPEKDDNYTFNDHIGRNSTFKVGLDKGKDIEVYVGDTKLNKDQYTIEYSEKTGFNDGDWNGAATGWSSSESDKAKARSIRVTLKKTTKIPKASTVKVKVPAKILTKSALPGDYAWNTFGYHYTSENGEALEAGPGRVGIKIYSTPEIEKKVIKGVKPYELAQDEIFNFVIHKEADNIDLPLKSVDQVKKILDEKGVPYAIYQVPIKAGDSRGHRILLDKNFAIDEIDKSNKNKAVAPLYASANWQWENGASYRLQELQDNNKFVQDEINNMKTTSYVFKYDSSKPQIFEVQNRYANWGIDITKTNKKKPDQVLDGAYFAIYGRDKEKAAANQAKVSKFIASEGLKAESIKTEFVNNGETYYLFDVGKTKDGGKLAFRNLTETKYGLCEVKAPKDFVLDSEMKFVTMDYIQGDTNVVSLPIVNIPVIILPKTGGPGTWAFIALGLGLIVASGVMALRKLKRM